MSQQSRGKRAELGTIIDDAMSISKEENRGGFNMAIKTEILDELDELDVKPVAVVKPKVAKGKKTLSVEQKAKMQAGRKAKKVEEVKEEEPKKAKSVKSNKVVDDLEKKNKDLEKENAKLKEKITILEGKTANYDNIITVDVQNTDDRKKIMQLMQEGKYVVNSSKRPFILCDHPSAADSVAKPIVRTVLCDEIIDVHIYMYCTDVHSVSEDLLPAMQYNKRLYMYHKGYHTCDMLGEEQLQYLLDNKFITEDQIFYNFIELSSGKAYTSKSETLTKKIIQQQDASFDAMMAVLLPQNHSYSYDENEVVKSDEVDDPDDEVISDIDEEAKNLKKDVEKNIEDEEDLEELD